MDNQIDLTICQDCKANPAVYGDGLTWSKCSACQLKAQQAENQTEAMQQDSVNEGSGIPHQIVPGLTSIILPVYMVNYTLFHYTGNCIGAVREHTPADQYELVVVDNGSPLQPPELTSYYADRVIKNSENLGVTKAWNQGIRMSIGEYIVLLNNDVQVFSYWLQDMKKALDQDGYDLVMAHPMYSLTEPFARAIESEQIRQKAIESGKIYSEFKDFSCVMFKRSLVDEIGLFDEQFFSYCSDSDFFKRMEEAGKKWACVDIVPTSHISDATGYAMPQTPEIMNKDKELYKQKWADKPKTQPGTEFLRVIDGGDPIYYRVGNEVHHIMDPDTLRALGGDFGLERSITEDEFRRYQQKEDISMDNVKNYA